MTLWDQEWYFSSSYRSFFARLGEKRSVRSKPDFCSGQIDAAQVQPAGYPLGGASFASAVALAPRGVRVAHVPHVVDHYK